MYGAQILMFWKHLFPSRKHHCNQFLFMQLNIAGTVYTNAGERRLWDPIVMAAANPQTIWIFCVDFLRD